ncbi:MAG: hypothetical protein AB7E84_04370, partial [Xanthobacteraceae bacterium]
AATIALYRAGERQLDHLKISAKRQSSDMQDSVAAATVAAKQSKRSADAAEQAIVWTNRPWIEIDLRIAGPLKFERDKIEISVVGTFKNIGRSPAIDLHFNFDLYPDVLSAFNKLREAVRQVTNMPGVGPTSNGPVIFPDQWGSREKIIAVARDAFVLRLDELNRDFPEESRFMGLNPAVGAVAYYRLPGSQPSEGYRCSTLLLEINSNFFPKGFDGKEQTVARDNIELVQTLFNADTT